MKKSWRALTAFAVIGLCVAVLNVGPAEAATPTLVSPERVYALKNTLVAFTGDDPISGDHKDMQVTAAVGACDPKAANHYAVGGCPRIQLTVGHGTLAIDESTFFSDPLDPEGMSSSGAIIDSTGNGDGTGAAISFNGTKAQIEGTLATLTFTPDTDYVNENDAPAYLQVHLGDGPTSDSVDKTIEIRVAQKNTYQTLTVGADQSVAAGSTTYLPAVMPGVNALGDFSVEDTDIPDIDSSHNFLLVMFATCGTFTLRGGALTLNNDIKNLLTGSPLNFDPDLADLVVALLPSDVTGQPFATGTPSDPHVALAGVGSLDEVNYALSYVGFIAPPTGGSCDLVTVVSDLGNIGLPIDYVGSPIGGADVPQPGFEVPDTIPSVGITNYKVDNGVTVSVPATLTVAEGSSVDIPISVDSSNHPAFDVGLDAADITANGFGVDYNDPATPASYLVNSPGPVLAPLSTVDDALVEGDETLTVTISLPGMPPGVVIGNDTVTITITDDEMATTTTSTSTTTSSTTSTTDPSTTTSTTDPSTTSTSTTSTTSTTMPTTTSTTSTSTTSTTMPTTTSTTSTTMPTTTSTTSTTMPTTTSTTSTTMPTTTSTTSTTMPTTTSTTSTTMPTTTSTTSTTMPTTSTTSTTAPSTSTTSTTAPSTTSTTAPGSTTTTTPGATVPGTVVDTTTTTSSTVPGETTTTIVSSGTTEGTVTSVISTDTVDPGGVLGTDDGVDGTNTQQYGSGLARTGSGLVAPFVLGLSLLLVGLASVKVSRRRS